MEEEDEVNVFEVEVFEVVDLAFVWAAVEEVLVFLYDSGPWPGACWMSLPCSAMRAGPSVRSCFRSWGTIFARTRSFTGCLELESEWTLISNWVVGGKLWRWEGV